MPPIQLNRRRFIGYSTAAGLALGPVALAEAVGGKEPARTVRLALIGLGNRGTSLLRQALELAGAQVVAVCDAEPKHAVRAQNIVEKAGQPRPERFDDPRRVFDRPEVEAAIIALPCDIHESTYLAALQAGKSLYAEKPLAINLAACDRLIAAAASAPDLVFHVGFQRRSNPRFREGVALVRNGELGELIDARATWTSSNGPVNGHKGWLGQRVRSGDWMVEQGVHIWDILAWLKGAPPARAIGWGRRDLFASTEPKRDVTDHYSVELEWTDGFKASFLHSWIAPADDAFTGTTFLVQGREGGLDFSSGSLTLLDKSRPRGLIQPGAQPDTRLALEAFLAAIRSEAPATPPITLAEAKVATEIGLLVRMAVDERRLVTFAEMREREQSSAG
jgi:predicted dehydrogenase